MTRSRCQEDGSQAGPVEDAGPEGADVGTGADAEKDDGEQTLEVEESRHGVCKLPGSQWSRHFGYIFVEASISDEDKIGSGT